MPLFLSNIGIISRIAWILNEQIQLWHNIGIACTDTKMIIVMKKIMLMVLIASAIILPATSNAQINIQINLGNQPAWGPAGYQTVQYYYLPDIDSYYDVNRSQFIYLNGPNWVFTKQLPARYRGYNLYNGYKVVINEPRPYLYHQTHRVKYVKYKNYKGKQQVIKGKGPGKSAKHFAPGQQKKRH
ncbi:MAG: hypothetical protein EOO99_09795 [Pedobacter sp.]|nr:MAG: hypothetical protein EOO99_09795 [Pedobacter sp.]